MVEGVPTMVGYIGCDPTDDGQVSWRTCNLAFLPRTYRERTGKHLFNFQGSAEGVEVVPLTALSFLRHKNTLPNLRVWKDYSGMGTAPPKQLKLTSSIG